MPPALALSAWAAALLRGGRRSALTLVAVLLAVSVWAAALLRGGRRSALTLVAVRLAVSVWAAALLRGGRRSRPDLGCRPAGRERLGRCPVARRAAGALTLVAVLLAVSVWAAALLRGGRWSAFLGDGRRSGWRAVLGAQIADAVVCRGWPAALVALPALEGGGRPSLVLVVVSNDRCVRSLQYVTSSRDRWEPATLQVLQ